LIGFMHFAFELLDEGLVESGRHFKPLGYELRLGEAPVRLSCFKGQKRRNGRAGAFIYGVVCAVR
jgi:hypothetical protein